jgi:peptide chain release factor 3
MRDTPVIVFVNKLDREGLDPMDLLDEIEQKLKLKVRPLSYPIGVGRDFKGVYDMYQKSLVLFRAHGKQNEGEEDVIQINDLADPLLDKYVGASAAEKLREEVELAEGVYPDWSHEEYLKGKLSPVFFGSAVNNFGVKELLDCFVDIAPTPQARSTDTREVQPEEAKFTGFVFKIHANMDPKHRDRLAFVRICSGVFERNTNYLHVRNGKDMKFSSPTAFMGDTKSIVDIAYPGDIVGIHDTGNFKIGDTLTQGEKMLYKGIPSFSPEQFRYVENADPLKTKQLAKGLGQLMDEGVAQLFTLQMNGRKIIGTVGALQFDVIQFRLLHEYGAACTYEPIGLHKACWLSGDAAEIAEFTRRYLRLMAYDKEGKVVYLAESAWALQMAEENFKGIRFHTTSEV